jgi:copper chaperone CopZ
MKLTFSLLLLFVFVIGCSSKQSNSVKTEVIAVNSVVCGMCEKTITDALKKIDGVQNVVIDLEKKTASVSFLPEKTSLAVLENSITSVGYNANEELRNPEAYEQLDACCKK